MDRVTLASRPSARTFSSSGLAALLILAACSDTKGDSSMTDRSAAQAGAGDKQPKPPAAAPSGDDTPAPAANPRPMSMSESPNTDDMLDMNATKPPPGGRGADGEISPECQGFELAGLKYSPGGRVLPNTCAAFDPFSNNPYAVRCIDAMPGYATRYAGDNYCILPPPPDEGVQFGVHPQKSKFWDAMHAGDVSGYDEPSLVRDYELAAGEEQLQIYDTTTSLPAGKHFYRIDFRARTGSHHSVTRFMHSPPVAREGWVPNDDSFNGLGTPLLDVQRANFDIPVSTLDIPEDEAGIGLEAPSDTSISFQLHHFNTGNQPLLREVWLNIWFMKDEDVKRSARHSSGVGNVNYPPNEITDVGGTVTANENLKLLRLFGHRHAWTTTFNVWLARANSKGEELIYSSNNWEEVPTFAYNSTTKNPSPDDRARIDGAYSGALDLARGDSLRFNCHAEVTPEHAAELGVSLPTTPLRFANEAFTGEMCVMGITATGKFDGAY